MYCYAKDVRARLLVVTGMSGQYLGILNKINATAQISETGRAKGVSSLVPTSQEKRAIIRCHGCLCGWKSSDQSAAFAVWGI